MKTVRKLENKHSCLSLSVNGDNILVTHLIGNRMADSFNQHFQPWPLFKSADQADFNSCRIKSISLCVPKLLKKLVNKQQIHHLEMYNVLSSVQSGFTHLMDISLLF